MWIVTRKCNQCNTKYNFSPYRLKKTKFCSLVCAAQNRTGEKNSNWKGGEITRTDGYELVRIGTASRDKKGKRYELKHRLVMEEHLGRKLSEDEVVHHINGNKSDNRIENLEILEHQSVHAKIHSKERVRNPQGMYV